MRTQTFLFISDPVKHRWSFWTAVQAVGQIPSFYKLVLLHQLQWSDTDLSCLGNLANWF